MEVCGALAYSNIPIGVLPGGTGNLLSRALGVPATMRRAVPALLSGTEREIDLGMVFGRHFAVAAGVGVDAAMVENTTPRMKRRLGVIGYTITAMRAALHAVIRRRFFLVRVEVNGEIIERRATSVLFANFGAILDDRISFGPDIEAHDGLLDCCIFSPAHLRDGIRILWCALRGAPQNEAVVLYRKGARFLIQTDPAMPMQADGDLLGVTPAEITVQPLAARLLVPAS